MIYTEQTVHELKTPSDVKYALASNNHFFEPSTMKFFGDRMASFALRSMDGKRYLYRRPSAKVNVFGTQKTAGRDFFGCWEIVPKHDHVDLVHSSEEIKDKLYSII
jgi:hypothetical protein